MSDSEWDAPNPAGPGPSSGLSRPALTPGQIAYLRGQRDAVRRLTTPRMTVTRVIVGVVWGAVALGFAIGAIYNLVHPDIGQALAGIGISALAGWYDYRIWTLRARKLLFVL